jgi:ubiquinone/menaquinone biosynthesis C-methylase UbiE
MSEYVLGTSDHELERLALQHEVWLEITTRVLDRLELGQGERVVDLGCGPGFVLEMFRERVGDTGEVIGVDESERWIEHIAARSADRGWTNVRPMHARIQDLDLEPASVDLIFMRWVLGFLGDRMEVLRSLARFLRPGGRLVVMDYNHNGVSLFPECDSFWAVIRATRQLYETRGGDTWVMGEIFDLFRRAELEPESLSPDLVAGPPGSPAWRWAEAFFPFHTKGMVAAGVLTNEDRDRFLADWDERNADPGSLFFSPIVATAIARKPR